MLGSFKRYGLDPVTLPDNMKATVPDCGTLTDNVEVIGYKLRNFN